MLGWFKKNAPIRQKFRALLALHTTLAALAAGGAYAAGHGAPTAGFLVALAVVAATALALLVSGKLVCDPYVNTVVRMEALADGDLSSPIRYTDHGDCVGRMTKAMAVFRDNAARTQELAEGQKSVVDRLDRALATLAAGDVGHRIDTPFSGAYDAVRVSFNRAVTDLEASLARVAASSQTVRSGSEEITTASDDLAERTERQAAALEETTAAMSQLTQMVSGTAQGADNVRSAIAEAHSDASEGGKVVGEAVEAMDTIEKSSQEINQIINVIDGIAFQTNLLALNAGVEAARAGDAGKGFAVVANEVRALAQRSADAATDIKALIGAANRHVGHGVELVGRTGRMLERIVAKIGEVNALIADIAANSETQAENLRQISGTVIDMDKMTQQNAALVEETTAAARSLSGQASELADLVARFRLNSGAALAPASSRAESETAPMAVSPIPRPAPKPAAKAAPVPLSTGNLALKMSPEAETDWADF